MKQAQGEPKSIIAGSGRLRARQTESVYLLTLDGWRAIAIAAVTVSYAKDTLVEFG